MPKIMRKTSLKIQMLAGNSFISRPDSDSQKKLPLVKSQKYTTLFKVRCHSKATLPKVTKLLNVTTSATLRVLSDERSQARLKRNQSITRMLIGIIVMFLICHTGKVLLLSYL